MTIYHTYDTEDGHQNYLGNFTCFSKCILIILLLQFNQPMVFEKVYKFDKKVDFQHFCLFGAPLGHIGQQVLTRCWPKYFFLKDHFKVTRKCIYIVRISPIFAKLRLETFWGATAATGPNSLLASSQNKKHFFEAFSYVQNW